MSLLTPAEVQAFGVGLALASSDLQTLIDREEAELVRRYGAHASAAPFTETARGSGRNLYLKRPIASVSSVTEYLFLGDTAPSVLTVSDYFVWGEQGRLERIMTANQWGQIAVVVYTPIDDTDVRKSVLLELVRIGSEQSASSGGGSVSGLSFSISGDTSAAGGWDTQRAAQYARLGWLSQ